MDFLKTIAAHVISNLLVVLILFFIFKTIEGYTKDKTQPTQPEKPCGCGGHSKENPEPKPSAEMPQTLLPINAQQEISKLFGSGFSF